MSDYVTDTTYKNCNSKLTTRNYIMLLVAVAIVAAGAASLSLTNNPDSNGRIEYHNNDALNNKLSQTNEKCPEITELFSIGTSFNGHDIQGIRFGSQWNLQNPSFKNLTRIGLIGNMHGNEATGREILAWLVSYLCDEKTTEFSQKLLQNTVLTILPTINPDGFSRRQNVGVSDSYGSHTHWVEGRYTRDPNCEVSTSSGGCDNIDMNRDFPDVGKAFHENNEHAFDQQFFESDSFTNNYPQNSDATETKLVKTFLKENPFDFALNFHDGATVVSYPLDSAKSQSTQAAYSSSPDDGIYRKLANTYAKNWPNIDNPCTSEFPSGTTNGADWYSLTGGLQDYSYLVYGTLHMTIEVSCVKFPGENELGVVVQSNKEPVKAYLTDLAEERFPKVYGVAVDRVGEKITFVKGETNLFTYVSSDGSFKRVLPEKGEWRILGLNLEVLGNFVIDQNTEVLV